MGANTSWGLGILSVPDDLDQASLCSVGFLPVSPSRL